MEMNFCRRCAAPVIKESGNVFQCANGHIAFENPTPAVGIFFLTHDNEVLLSVRGIEPHKGMLDSFGGFVDQEETLEQAAARELKEELNLDSSEYEPLQYLGSGNGHYPYKGETYLIITSFYWTRLTTNKQLTAQDDVAAIKSLPLSEVNLDQVHDTDVRDGILMLQKFVSENKL